MSDDENKPTDAFREGLKAKHGEVYEAKFKDVGGVEVSVYFRELRGVEYNRFLDKTMDKDPKRMAGGIREVGRCVIVHPAGDALESLLDRRPGILSKVADDVLKIAQGEAADLGKGL